ncbi:hypothetical protein FRC06_011117 [Ceratobasidium sp. 370]|nr:hypothetical protein FRC06_011117 [Ceratobasidium sp. 370]
MQYVGKRVLPECIFSDRLSPLPEDRRKRVLFDTRPQLKQEKSWQVEVRRKFRRATANPTRLSDYSFAQHQAHADRSLPKLGQPGWRKGPEVRLDCNQPTAVVGSDKSVGLIYIPGFLNGSSLVNFSQSTEEHMRLELRPSHQNQPSRPTRAHAWPRNTGDVPQHDRGFTGDCHFGMWHARGHQHSDSYEPTHETTRNTSNIQWTSRIRFFDSNYVTDHRVEYLMDLARPDLMAKLKTARQRVLEHPGVLPFDAIWHTSFLGRAVIVNRETGEHLDRLGVRRAWDVVVAAGDFKGGDFFFRDMNVRCPFQPGDLVAFDGTAQRHKIEPFAGCIRLSHVYFIHQSILTELGIDSGLPDVYLSDLVSHIAPFARAPPIQGPLPPPRSTRRKRVEEGSPGPATLRRKTARDCTLVPTSVFLASVCLN